MTSNALPTVYRGIQFRSRLEVTWAVFFEQCGIRWRYEPIALGWYIPDFLLDRLLVEVKPIGDRQTADRAIQRAAAQTIEGSGWTGDFLIVGKYLRGGLLGVHGKRAGNSWRYRMAHVSLLSIAEPVAAAHWTHAQRITRVGRGAPRAPEHIVGPLGRAIRSLYEPSDEG